jgi:hypothetical protein
MKQQACEQPGSGKSLCFMLPGALLAAAAYEIPVDKDNIPT